MFESKITSDIIVKSIDSIEKGPSTKGNSWSGSEFPFEFIKLMSVTNIIFFLPCLNDEVAEDIYFFGKSRSGRVYGDVMISDNVFDSDSLISCYFYYFFSSIGMPSFSSTKKPDMSSVNYIPVENQLFKFLIS